MPHVRAIRCFAIFVVFVCLAAAGVSCARAGADSSTSVDLSGPWLTQSGDNKDWGSASIKDTDWQPISLPGTSVASGYTWYRKHFKLPSDWAEDRQVLRFNRLYLHLGALRGAATIYINGYQINQLGKSPKANGIGFQAISPSDNVTVIVPESAQVQGEGTSTIVNWGADNVIAIRLYDAASGPDPAAGPIAIGLPTLAELYPTTFATPQADHLFGGQNQVAYTLTCANTTDVAAPLDWSADIFNDTGAAVPGYQPQVTTGSIDPAGASAYRSSLAFGAFPGFYTFSVNTKIDGNSLPPTIFVAGWDADKIRSDETPPADFDAFWTQLRDDAAGGTLHTQVDKDASIKSAGVSVYRVQFAGIGGGPVYAWVSVPAGLQANPVVILHIPAYDADSTSPDIDMAKRGYVVVNLLVTATDWTSGNAGEDYMSRGADSPQTYIFRNIEGNILRAVRLLGSGDIPGLPAQHRLVLWGESQGGGLALISGGLLKQNVAAIVAISPYFTDMAHTLSCAKDDNPFAAYIAGHPSGSHELISTLSYFDTVHFTPAIAAPVFFSIGLTDKVVPPFSEFAAANGIASARTMDVEPNSGHIPPDARSRALSWLATTLK